MRDQPNQVHPALRQRLLDGVFHPSESLTEVTLAAEGAETQMRRPIANLRAVLRRHFELLL
jgi:hypothetical protein